MYQMNDTLYIIIPYFNFFQNKWRNENLFNLLDSLNKFNKIDSKTKFEVILVEGRTDDLEGDSPLFNFINRKKEYANTRCISYKIPQKIWVKENLINITIEKHLPEDWQYFCWLDGDIIFDDPFWIKKAIESLRQNDIIQVFSVCMNQLYADRREYTSHYSFLKFLSIGTDLIKKLCAKHTGYGWGMSKDFYKKIGKLWEFHIIGGGDTVIAKCVNQEIKKDFCHHAKNMYSPELISDVLIYQNKFKNCKHSFLDVNIFHLYHGDIGRRQYLSRHHILKNYNYNSSFTKYNEEGIIYLEDENLKNEIEYYFNNREKT
jgi:hypothetical protein